MPVEQERRGRILVIQIAREDKRNAIDGEVAHGIDAALNVLDDDPELWAGVLTGGPRMFSAGTDLKDGARARTERGGEYGIIRRDREKPLIAAVEGVAFGGGFEIALACDLVVAASDATFALPEVKRGVVASSGALFRLTRALPRNLATELLITGEPLTPQRGYEFGFVNAVVEPGQALEHAIAMAERICANAPISVRASLRALRTLTADADAAGWDATSTAVERILAAADMKEGVAAFFAKRPPEWTGR
jgi:enoyl-CoA hydratase